jgi:hypothetical protein
MGKKYVWRLSYGHWLFSWVLQKVGKLTMGSVLRILIDLPLASPQETCWHADGLIGTNGTYVWQSKGYSSWSISYSASYTQIALHCSQVDRMDWGTDRGLNFSCIFPRIILTFHNMRALISRRSFLLSSTSFRALLLYSTTLPPKYSLGGWRQKLLATYLWTIDWVHVINSSTSQVKKRCKHK